MINMKLRGRRSVPHDGDDDDDYDDYDDYDDDGDADADDR